MKRIIYLSILILLSSCNRVAYEQRLERKGKIKCGWYGKMTTEQRRKTFPFSEAHKIVLVSYPNYATSYAYLIDSITTPWGEKLPFGSVTKSYFKITQPFIDTIKVFYRQYLAYEKAELSQNQIDALSNLYFNYKKNRKTRIVKTYVSCCYKPRNSILFYDKDGIPVFNFEICFECSESLVFKNFEVVSENQFEDKCMNYELYKDFFKQCQIKYGIESNE